MKIKSYLIDHRENLQLAYGIFLIILIPLLISYNTISIINRYNRGMDVALQRNALVMGRSIYAMLQDDLSDTAKIQAKLDKITTQTGELENVAVMAKEGEKFKIVASSDPAEIGRVLDFYYYQTAWLQPDNDGLATDTLKLATTADGVSLASDPGNAGRFWLVAMPMQNASGEKQALLSMRVSSKVIDNLTESNRTASTFVLLVTVLVTVLFLSIVVRLWDYVLLYKKIKEVDQMKDEFISIASHELRTPLTAIKGYASLIDEGTFGPLENKDLKSSVERILASSRRMEDLVEDLLNVSRLEQGRLTAEIQEFPLEPVIEEMTAQLSVTAAEKQLQLEYKKPATPLPPVAADSDRLKQILVNIIGNAIKYTETGGVTITSEIQDGKARIQVTDTGLGIAPEAQKRLFQKFYRVRTEKTESIQGTGLGLWITKQIVELMHGEIFLESIVGSGTQITILLPLAKPAAK